jgi:hypothetical protein
MLLLLAVLAGASFQDTDTTVAVRPGSRLSLENYEGSVTLATWNRNAVRVQATHDEDAYVDVDVNGASVRVRGHGRHGPPEMDYRITVPAEISLEIEVHDGDVRLAGTRGEIDVQTVEGNVTVNGGAGRVSLQSVDGDIALTGARGRISVNAIDGAVHLRDCAGDVQINAVDGEVRLEGVDASSIEATSVDGAILFSGAIRDGGSYRLSSHDGDVTVVTPAINAAVTVSTYTGEFESDFPVTITGRSSRKRLDFTLGTGSARLELESFDGTVALRKGSDR